ncbi:type II secretion system secretin GspD [Sphingosinithalassobacter sp. CS137]|uniref:type II secretion system secretin GspD n=1 Tax=Sphingosinithalassobacter sp. CS137 TaxID=2762748 RepID=UPI00165D85E0|nr:type II secretion system secretin GspD [Sphingosinithalassobacter sp. CS137]
MTSLRSIVATLALGATALQPIPLLAQTVPPPVQDAPAGPPADVVVNMRGVEITDVADQISRITGRTLILDPAVQGKVTVTSATPLTPSGVWELFLSVLRANGFAAVRSGRAWRIVPQANAVRDGGVPGRGVSGQELTTRMIRLANVPSGEVARVVRPLVANFGSVEPLTSPNAIVVTDYADNVRRIEAIARSLDGGSGSTFATINLQYGNAAEVAQALQGVLAADPATVGATRIAADARSNTVIVRGTPSAVAEARRIAAALDTPGGTTAMTRVFRLNYADAESVTAVLQGVLGIEAEATNPVARSLSSRSSQSLRPSPTRALSELTSGNAATAAAAVAGGQTERTPLTSGGNEGQPAQGFSTPEVTVQPAPDINAVVVRGTPTAVASIEALITELDVRRPQVLIEAIIAEIQGDDAETLAMQIGTSGAVLDQVEGIGTSFGNPGPSLGTILTALGVPAGQLLGEGLTGNIAFGDDFSVLLRAIGVSERANLLSAPQTMAVDNTPAEIVVAQEVPFVTGSILTGNTDVAPYTSIERKNVGLTLRVLPRINAGDTIRLEVSVEASSIAPIQVQGAADIITNQRSVINTVLADNGSTYVLGGLISDDYTDSRRQVPVLGDIPILGELFKSRSERRLKRTLFIFIRPTILRDGADAAAVAQDRYNRLRADELESIERESLLLKPPTPRLTVEIDGIY